MIHSDLKMLKILNIKWLHPPNHQATDLNPPKVHTKYENNPFIIVVWSLRKPVAAVAAAVDNFNQNESIPNFDLG
jgi:hypothetical protein